MATRTQATCRAWMLSPATAGDRCILKRKVRNFVGLVKEQHEREPVEAKKALKSMCGKSHPEPAGTSVPIQR